jgi:hypothetical protein
MENDCLRNLTIALRSISTSLLYKSSKFEDGNVLLSKPKTLPRDESCYRFVY